MKQTRLMFVRLLLLLTITLTAGRAATAQENPQLTEGFEAIGPAHATGAERQRQPDLWTFEIIYKPMRLRWIEVTDARTGEKKREQVWYLAFKTIRRPLRTTDTEGDTTPINTLDTPPGPVQFIPEFTLITYDDPAVELPKETAIDMILPGATTVINKVERRRGTPEYLNTVALIQDLPAAVPTDTTDQPYLNGVATWTGIDPETDFFKVVIRGLTNAYEIRTDADGNDRTWRKVLVQKFDRRGDTFDPDQIEFELSGEPEWKYVPDAE